MPNNFIITPPPERTEEALQLVFCDLSEADRRERVCEHLAACSECKNSADKKTPAILLAYMQGNTLLGAVLARVQRGKTAILWPPRLSAGAESQIADTLLATALEHLVQHPLSMVNVLLDEEIQISDESLLLRNGFERLADLLYMFCPCEGIDPTAAAEIQIRSGLEFEPYNESNHDRFSQVVEITYNQTRDCPRLNGRRSIADVLEGYRDLGRFDPTNWFVVRHRVDDVGCLILADYPEFGNIELVYMGIIPSRRGHGWGKEITQYAKCRAAARNRPRMVLAVDAENRPAIDMYVSAGLSVWEKRTAYAKFF